MVKIGANQKNTVRLKQLPEVSADQLPVLDTETPDIVVKDLFALGPKLSPAALKAVRQLTVERFEVNNLGTEFSGLARGLERDLANADGGLSATLILEQHARHLVKLAPSDAALEQGAARMLQVAFNSPARGDPSRPAGDPWSAKEWPTVGDATTQLATLLEARGLRPRELPLERTPAKATGWWSKLPVQAPLFRNASRDADVEQALMDVGTVSFEQALVDVDDLEQILG